MTAGVLLVCGTSSKLGHSMERYFGEYAHIHEESKMICVVTIGGGM
jgi:hypothetical protein